MDNPSNALGKARSFWEKPEGTTGMIFAVALGILGIWGVGQMLPWLVSFMDSLFHVIIVGAASAGLLWVLFDKRFQTLLWFGYQSIMRAITSWFVTVDPIGIVRNYILEMKKNLQKMLTQIGSLQGQYSSLERKIQANEQQIDKCMKIAKKAGDGLSLLLCASLAVKYLRMGANLQPLGNLALHRHPSP